MRTLTVTESACPSSKSVPENDGVDGSSRIVRLTLPVQLACRAVVRGAGYCTDEGARLSS